MSPPQNGREADISHHVEETFWRLPDPMVIAENIEYRSWRQSTRLRWIRKRKAGKLRGRSRGGKDPEGWRGGRRPEDEKGGHQQRFLNHLRQDLTNSSPAILR